MTYEKGKKLFKTNIAIPFTTDKAVFTYGGSLGVGIHTEQLSIDTDDAKKIIRIISKEKSTGSVQNRWIFGYNRIYAFVNQSAEISISPLLACTHREEPPVPSWQ